MTTFKAVVQRHQKRADNKYPVSIRITHNRQSKYVPTGIYVPMRGINSKSFELKDQFVIERMNQNIREMEARLLNVSMTELKEMSVEAVKRLVCASNGRIDYLSYCKDLIAREPKKRAILRSAIRVMEVDMEIKELSIRELSVGFINKYKSVLDEKVLPNGEKMSPVTKSNYMVALLSAFNCMRDEYNTEYDKVIPYNPFENVDRYVIPISKRRSADGEVIREVLNYKSDKKFIQVGLDIAKFSFCTCGMNAADIAVLKTEQYKDGRITYNRAKTKGRRHDSALTSVKVEPEIADIVKKYQSKGMLFGLGRSAGAISQTVNNVLRIVCKELNVEQMTLYWFRHSWATIARNKCGVSKDDVDLCLNHVGNNPMADVYIAPDWTPIDVANRKVLDYVFGEK